MPMNSRRGGGDFAKQISSTYRQALRDPRKSLVDDVNSSAKNGNIDEKLLAQRYAPKSIGDIAPGGPEPGGLPQQLPGQGALSDNDPGPQGPTANNGILGGALARFAPPDVSKWSANIPKPASVTAPDAPGAVKPPEVSQPYGGGPQEYQTAGHFGGMMGGDKSEKLASILAPQGVDGEDTGLTQPNDLSGGAPPPTPNPDQSALTAFRQQQALKPQAPPPQAGTNPMTPPPRPPMGGPPQGMPPRPPMGMGRQMPMGPPPPQGGPPPGGVPMPPAPPPGGAPLGMPPQMGMAGAMGGAMPAPGDQQAQLIAQIQAMANARGFG